ncbi:MAG: thymidylate kinase [Candidatus Moranbacteria bacterium]|nr:thymidylate kinase [Candidatus Moranbacteria bacterium]
MIDRNFPKGKFIVIDGTDGSGKATQTQILVKRLKKEGYKVATVDFPQYGKKSASLVEEYLNGEFGTALEVGPYRASIFYACDRYAAAKKIKKWLSEGKIIISNRYVTANMGHQGGKIKSRKERAKYFKWLYDLEYNIFKIPRPDLNLILHVDAAVAQKLVDSKEERDYIKQGGKRDIHEKDLGHLRDAERVYLEIADIFPDIELVECAENDTIMTREKISGLVFDLVISKIL